MKKFAQRQSCRPYHSFEDDVVGVHNQVKPLLQPRQLVPVSHVRSAAMMLHHLAHANTGTQRKELIFQVADYSAKPCMSKAQSDKDNQEIMSGAIIDCKWTMRVELQCVVW